jgi:hypothetical protein
VSGSDIRDATTRSTSSSVRRMKEAVRAQKESGHAGSRAI